MTERRPARAIKVGLCGFTMAQARYAAHFPVVEVQQTFYDPPADKLLDRWRAMVPAEFEFTLKAWQLITHLGTSPTYRRLKRALTDRERADAGAFRATEIVDHAWRVSLACAERLRATAMLFQCPASFRPTPEHLANLRGFLGRVARPPGLRLMFEPRGPAWTYELARPLCDELGLVYVVDPFVTPWRARRGDAVTYLRLHGVTGARHVYDEAELDALGGMLPVDGDVYVMFNNIPRVADARRFMQRLGLDRTTRAT
jgi:uncharacterized protein YecE (DUF72 family)